MRKEQLIDFQSVPCAVRTVDESEHKNSRIYMTHETEEAHCQKVGRQYVAQNLTKCGISIIKIRAPQTMQHTHIVNTETI